MTGLEALQAVQYVSAKGRRLAVIDADDWETLIEWPDWFKAGRRSPTGRYTFTTARHYGKDGRLMPSGLFGPVRVLSSEQREVEAVQ